MLLGDDDRPTRDEKWVSALFSLFFLFFYKKGGGGGRKQFICVGKKSEYRGRERKSTTYCSHTP